VPLKHILALKEAKFEELPANVFVKGYLLKIAKVLNVDFEELWNLYLEDYNKLAMPKPDILPSNRFEQSKKVTHHLLKILRYIPIGGYYYRHRFYFFTKQKFIWRAKIKSDNAGF